MLKVCVAATAAVLMTGAAQAAVIDFEGFSHSDVVNTVSAGDINATVSVASRGRVNMAMAFDTTLSNTRDPDLEGPFTGPVADPGKVLIIAENAREADDERRGGVITFDFDRPVNFLGFDVFDDIMITVTSNLGNVFSFMGLSDNESERFVLSGFLGITSLSFDLAGSGAIDSLVVEASDIAPIPVPAALPLMLAGLGGLGLVARRRRRAA